MLNKQQFAEPDSGSARPMSMQQAHGYALQQSLDREREKRQGIKGIPARVGDLVDRIYERFD